VPQREGRSEEAERKSIEALARGTLHRGADALHWLRKTSAWHWSLLMDKTTAEIAQNSVLIHASAAFSVGLMPIPVVDLLGISLTQISLVRQLSSIYGVKFSEQLGRSIITALAGGTLSVAAPSLIKAVPVVGSMMGAVVMPTVAGASTYAIGRIFIKHFESGGTLLTLDPDRVRDAYTEELEEGKKVVEGGGYPGGSSGVKP